MKKIFAILLTLTMLFSIASYAFATNEKTVLEEEAAIKAVNPSLHLDVAVNNVTSVKANVTYTAKLKYETNTVSLEKKPVTVYFYTGKQTSAAYPTKYIGKAIVDKNGTAILKIHQNPGKYTGGAICAVVNSKKIRSNVVFYEVPKPLKPELVLDVKVIKQLDADVINDETYVAGTVRPNVVYTAKLKNAPTIVEEGNKPIMVDFYTGNPLLTVYPNEYLGSAPVDKNGVAVLKIFQKPGKYAGGSICTLYEGEKIYSNVVIYEVPKPIVPPKPVLKLNVDVKDLSATDAVGNVTYTAVLLFPIEAPSIGTVEADATKTEAQLEYLVKPIKIDFYTGDPNVDSFPGKYIGSAYIKDGKARLTVMQKPGGYAGGAIWADTQWGRILSNIVYYKVPPVIDNDDAIKVVPSESVLVNPTKVVPKNTIKTGNALTD